MNPEISSSIVSPYSIHEHLYLKFLYGSINKKINKNPLQIFIKANEEKENEFREFVKKNYKNHPITDENFSIRGTLSNVLKIVKTDLESCLTFGELYLEKHYQSNAYREQIKRGQLGKALTFNQAKMFTCVAGHVHIPHSKLPTPLPPLDPKEKLYLKFIGGCLSESLENKCTVVFLGATEQMQKDFIQFAKERKVIYTLKNLNLIGIINSLAFRTQIEMDPMHFRDEAKYQETAAKALSLLKSKGFNGRMLTPRQAEILITYS